MDTDQSNNLLCSIQSEIAKYQLLIEEENQKLQRYKVNLLSMFSLMSMHPELASLTF